jgi:signal transduction histidine kinase/HAMP domain-containing protein
MKPIHVFRSFKAKIVVSILTVGILAVFIGLTVIYLVGRDQIQQGIGNQFKELAYQTSQKLLHLMDHNIEEAKLLAMSYEVRSSVDLANQSYSTTPLSEQELENRILAFNRLLTERDDQHPILRRILYGEASRYIDEFLSDPDERAEHISIIITDQYGFLVGADARPDTFYYGDQGWWKAAFSKGLGSTYISDVELMQQARSAGPAPVYGLGLVAPIMNKSGTEAVGVIRMNVQAKRFFDAVIKVKIGKTNHTMLASSDGSLIFCPVFLIRNHTLRPEFMKAIFQDQPGWTLTTADVHYGGRRSVNGFSPVRKSHKIHPASLGGKEWFIFTSQHPDETYAPIHALENWMAVSGIMGAIVLSFMGIYAAGFIVRPLQDLKKGARLIGFGNLDHRLRIETGDDIQELADEFNEMAVKLKASYSGLEQKVAERTKELAVVNKINRIISSSLNLRLIFETFTDEVKKLLNYDQIGIALLDESQKNIHIRMTKTKDGPLILRDSPLRSKVGTAVGLVVDHAEPFLQLDTLEAQQFVEDRLSIRNGFRSYIIVPIISKRVPIGTLNLLSKQPQAYSKRNLDILIPIAEQLAIAIETIRLFDQTRKLDQLKSDFVSKVSHELRTPLTSIKGFTEILLSYEDVDPNTQREFLNIINDESERLTRLINDILDLSKIEAGKIGWKIRPVSIAEIVEYAVRLLQSIAQDKNLQIDTEVSNDLPIVRGDRDQLLQVMDNLLSNAIKFTPSGKITIKAVKENDHVKVMVSDAGRGISQEDQSKIFDKFQQLGDVRTGKPPGTGLGLAICKEIIYHLGGKIWCESEIDKGSTFYVLLPIWTNHSQDVEMPETDKVHPTDARKHIERTS